MVEPKPDGTPYKWEIVTKKKREILNADDLSIRPWTARPGIRLRGLSKQLSHPNFLEELLDIRFMYSCKKRSVGWDSPAPPNLFAEVRQDANYQIAGGTVSMPSGSRVYSFDRDRCLCGLEHLRFNCWGSDVIFEGVTEDVWNRILSETTGDPPKRKKGKRGQNDLALAEMAGNGQALPDLALFTIPLVFVLRRPGLFKHDLDPEAIKSLFTTADGSFVELDPNWSQKHLRALRNKVGGCATLVDAEALPQIDELSD